MPKILKCQQTHRLKDHQPIRIILINQPHPHTSPAHPPNPPRKSNSETVLLINKIIFQLAIQVKKGLLINHLIKSL